ncbi:glycoside hydrolase [Kribbella turkmenica]|uniref:beta-fructofuranosidase n=1 Tax=Kribbella turkmenica TaxID=2530375 RepID=A0A4R4X9T5_9ACTN|nr:glycoside hydrolase family 32 protein [Kribbella turkmenica]TDD27298.1 glycoside hydrolase [Kribbella turkmenica]
MIHWRPVSGFVGDVIPFSHAERIWLFYLLDERPGDPTDGASGMPWALVSTTDFVHFTDHGVVLQAGDRDAEDFDCYTGSVVTDGSRLHLFYTGHNPRRGDADGAFQVVCHAVSDGDPTEWTKLPAHTFGAPAGYMPQDWRDPFVYRTAPDEPWQMVLAARYTDSPARRRGVVARLTSTDLEQWELADPLWEPHRFITQECPDVFRWGDWWYLVYSEFTDAFQTRYRIARGPDGPWLAPRRDTVDGRAFYAAKSVEHAGRRFFIGWIPTKQGDCDAGSWQWAGDLAVLEARQEDDGTLAFGLPAEILAAFSDAEQVKLAAVDGAATKPGEGAVDRYAAWIGDPVPERCLITVRADVEAGTQAFGVLLHAGADGEDGTVVRLEPQRGRIVLDRWPRGRTGPAQWQVDGDVPYAVELERACPLPPGVHTVQVLLDGTTGQVVVDDRVALSFRRYEPGACRPGLFATDGGFTLASLTVAR